MKTTLAIVFIALVVVSTVAFRHIRDGKYYKHALIVLAATYVLGLLWFTLLSRKPAANAVVASKGDPEILSPGFQTRWRNCGNPDREDVRGNIAEYSAVHSLWVPSATDQLTQIMLESFFVWYRLFHHD